MKLTHTLIAMLWVFAVTVEAQTYGTFEGFLQSPDGYGDPVGTPDAPYTRPQDLQPTPFVVPYETTNIYRHPSQGALPEAPYITVPVQPGTGDIDRSDPWNNPW